MRARETSRALLLVQLLLLVDTGGGDVVGLEGREAHARTHAATPRRLSVSYYGAPNSNITTNYTLTLQQSGVTDAWIPYLQGAFAVDCCQTRTPAGDAAFERGGLHAGLVSLEQAKHEKLVDSYVSAGIRPWFMERPVPDFEWTSTAGAIGPELWNGSSAHADAGWAELAKNITEVYPRVKQLGFAGLVFDNEGYYSGTCTVNATPVSCLWDQHDAQTGRISESYYKRGKQVGDAIAGVWPGARITMVYGFPYQGLIEWVRGAFFSPIGLPRKLAQATVPSESKQFVDTSLLSLGLI
jgi:hypothetical protein